MAETSLLLVLCVAAGGAVGAVLRYLIALVLNPSGGIPWATLFVNFVGCSLMALLFFGWPAIPSEIRTFLFVGVFGAFTTMSSLSVETLDLYDSGKVGLAAANFGMNLAACIGGGILGKLASVLLAP
ncbi:MAG: CrcB family protein [Candidatus Methanoplasma sp.]|jgi:CrcB protein|nr:CrcB family protein [Candidatus Methanoplasma sp.]